MVKAAAAREWTLTPLRIPDRDAKKWADTHPLEQIRWTREKNQITNKHFVNVVKAIKWWRMECYPEMKHPKGFPLERMIGDCCPDNISSVAEGICSTFSNIVEKYAGGKPTLPDYGVSTHDVLGRISADDFAKFMTCATEAAVAASEAFLESKRAKACVLWRRLLGDKFPLRDDDDDKPSFRCEEPGNIAVVGPKRFA